MKKSFLFAMAVLSVAVVLAVPAKPTPIEVKQPDGTTITVIAKGDERIHWAETPDGYSLLRNAEGIYEYAIVNESGDMIASGIKAMNGGMKSAPSVKKHLRFSTQQKEAMFAKWQTPSRGTHKGIVKKIKEAKGGTVNFRAPVIMVNFTNRVCTFHKDSIDKILNTRGLTDSPNTGSVADYLSDNSRGTFQFNADVFGPYTLANNVAYYGGNVGGNDKNPEAMIVEAVNLAKADGCDFSQYDNDGDGYVDAVHVVFAGRGEEESNEADGVWSHQWYIRQDMTVDGKKIYTYSCSPERMGTSNKLNAIGIIVHEMGGHAMFDLPDFYDADYTGSGSDEAVTPGVYDVMDMGSWNNDGYTPPMHNPWSRMFIGWLERKLLTESCSVDMLPAMDATKCYIIETKTPNEYFILDDRPVNKWDDWNNTIPRVGGGLLIFAVDSNNKHWGDNCLNCNPSHRGLYIKQANGGNSSTSSMGRGTPFPGSTNNTQFTDATSPNSISRASVPTEKPVTNIRIENEHVLFDFMGGGNPEPPAFAIENLKQNDVIVFPNPASLLITVKSNDVVFGMELFDFIGKRIAVTVGSELSLQNISEGIYFLKIKTTAETITKKVIVKK